MEAGQELVQFAGIAAPQMIQIPLEEYRKYMESVIKGPTVEIPLEEYNRLKDENRELQDRLRGAEDYIRQLEREAENRKDLDEQTDIVTHMVADEMAEKIIKSVSDSVTELKEIIEIEKLKHCRR